MGFAALRLVLLLAASYYFYASWRPAYLVLIVFSSFLDFIVGARLHRSQDPVLRRRWLMVSLIGNLGLLGVFKYFNFFSASVYQGLLAFGVQTSPVYLDVLVPVGISFYTFQTLSYTIDIYRGDLEPEPSLLKFLLFVSFFPQLVAGPIVRASDFLPQLHRPVFLDDERGARALMLIAVGLFKKAIIADLLAVNLVDRVFESPVHYTSAELLLGVYGYALQIYCDFSAYSDIAIGSALLLGYELAINFNHPYRAHNLRDFWRRWHISLSTWLRDYLYISLGGSRGGSLATYRNLLLTMLLGGLWHGAAWTFVAWGALHGLGLAGTRAWQSRRGEAAGGPLLRLVKVIFTFHLVCLGWVFFRASDFQHAWELLVGIGQLEGGTANISPLLWGLLAVGFLTHLLPDRLLVLATEAFRRMPAPIQGLLFFGLVLFIHYAGSTQIVPFIYFQF